MELNISGMSPEQKAKIKTIVQLGQLFGGDASFSNYLMGELANVYNPQPKDTSDMDRAILNVLDPSDPESEVIFNNILAKYGYGPAAEGMTQDNLITNQMVDQGQLPEAQREVYPQVGNTFNRLTQADSSIAPSVSLLDRWKSAVNAASQPGAPLGRRSLAGWGAFLTR